MLSLRGAAATKPSSIPFAASWIASLALAMTERAASALVDFGEHFARDPKTVDARGHAGVDRHLHEDFADLVLAHAVDQRALDVDPQFVRPVEDRNHRQIEHAA